MVSDTIDLVQTQNELLALMKEVHSVLMKNGIKYSLTGGSLLGAIRHNGFIPWDDDIDIMVDRRNFIKLKKCLRTSKTFKLSRGYAYAPWLYRICAQKYNGKMLPTIDVFIMDNVPDNNILHKIKILQLRILQGMLKEKIHYQEFSCVHKFCILVTHIVGLIFSKQRKLKWYDRISSKDDWQKTGRISITNDSFGLLEKTYRSEILSSYKLHPFEDTEFMVIDRYHDYLSGRYGDYMTPPAENERIPGHIDRIQE